MLNKLYIGSNNDTKQVEKEYILALKDIAKIVTENKDKFTEKELLGQIYNRIECLENDEINKHLKY